MKTSHIRPPTHPPVSTATPNPSATSGLARLPRWTGPGRALAGAALVAAVAACAGGPGSGSAGPPSLSFQVPASGTVVYQVEDRATLIVDAGGQIMDIPIRSDAEVAMRFSPADGGVQVSGEYLALDAEVANPMGAPERASADQVEGPVVFTLDTRGRASVQGVPELRGGASRLVSPNTVAHTFFPRLPGTAVTPGMMWTDTISFDSAEEAGDVSVRSVVAYEVVGDTVVGGVSYLKVDYSSDDDFVQEGVNAGMAFTQEMRGTTRGHFLWDLREGVLHSLREESEYDGVMDVDMAPMALDVTMREERRVDRVPGS